IRDGIDLKRTMMFVILALIPCLLFGMYNVGLQHDLANSTVEWSGVDRFLFGLVRVLPFIVVSYGAGLGVEFIFAIKNGHAVQEGYLVSGMLIPLIMPIDTPLWMVAVSVVFAVVIGKEVFGGTGMNILNVALTARAFLFFAHPTSMSGNNVWISGFKELKGSGNLVDGVSGATPLGDLASFTQDQPAYSSLNEFIDNGHSFVEAMWGLYPGSIGESSVFPIMLGAIFLLITGIASWRVMTSFFVGGLVMALIMNQFAGENAYMPLPAIHHLMYGGFLFGMVFMITDPVTAAQTSKGKYFYGFLAGFLGILIRVVNPAYPEGIMLAILIANVFAPLIDHMVISTNIKRRLKRVKTA
ncbi:MAG: NADH:ubiquinone reductase (Na(+)-transporting) subunit B, partial [Flavobacteriales bacterium]|nr:NADH:ubiquinone reductase (Na(+)-transporting) subunit B [Flavobacteriales bacterium]